MISFQEFPPKLPIPIFYSLFFVSFLVFTTLSLEPPKTKLRYFILITLTVYLPTLPFVYRGRYEPIVICPMACFASGWCFKMMIWLKKCFSAEKEKEVGPFFWTLFFWRELPNRKGKELRLTTTKDVNLNIVQRIGLLFFKWVLVEMFYRWSTWTHLKNN